MHIYHMNSYIDNFDKISNEFYTLISKFNEKYV